MERICPSKSDSAGLTTALTGRRFSPDADHEILSKDVSSQRGTQVVNALSSEKSLIRHGGVDNHVDVWMMALVVKCSVPFQVIHGNFHAGCNCLRLGAQHVPPTLAGIKPQTFGILPTQGNDDGPDVALMVVQLLCYLAELNLYTAISEEAMRSDSFHPGRVPMYLA